MYCNDTKRKIIFLFIYIHSSFIYTIYIRNSSSYFHQHNHIIISQCYHHIIIIISLYHHIIIKQNHHIIIIISIYHHIIIKQNHLSYISCNNCLSQMHIEIITEEFIGKITHNYRRIIKIIIIVIGSKTHLHPLYTNQFPIKNC